MSYRCGICRTPRTVGQPRLSYVCYRPSGQIDREISVCSECDVLLVTGHSLEEVQRWRGPKVAHVPTMISKPDPTKPVALSGRSAVVGGLRR